MFRSCLKQQRPRFLAVVICLAIGSHQSFAQIAVVGSTVEEKTASPGETYTGRIVVRNLTGDSQPVRIYQTDYSFFADGTSRFDAPGTLSRSNASWVTPAIGFVVVPPSGETTIAYTVRLPSSDSLTGTYWSTVMVEGAVNKPRSTTAGEVSIGSVMRYAVQVATHLSSSGIAGKISFERQRSDSAVDGSRKVEVDVRNTGERAYRPVLWLELYDSNGALRARREQQRGLLYPGSSLKQTFELGKLPRGVYKGVIFADIGDEAVSAAQYKLTF